jgi:hypothetical protein
MQKQQPRGRACTHGEAGDIDLFETEVVDERSHVAGHRGVLVGLLVGRLA